MPRPCPRGPIRSSGGARFATRSRTCSRSSAEPGSQRAHEWGGCHSKSSAGGPSSSLIEVVSCGACRSGLAPPCDARALPGTDAVDVSMLRALFIDDDVDFLEGVAEIAAQEGFAVTVAHSLEQARAHLAKGPADLVLVDLNLPDGHGIDLLRELKETSSSDVVIVSGAATVDSAIEALRLGALDYLTKPLDNRRLKAVLANVLRLRSLKQEVGTLRGELRKFGRFGRLVGSAPAMQHVYDLIGKVAPTDASVFITEIG